MSSTLSRIQKLVTLGIVRISEHGYDELTADDILIDDVLAGVQAALIVEDYPNFAKGPSVLVLQKDGIGKPIHVVWGIPKDQEEPAVVVTAYRPDPARWNHDFTKRKYHE